MEYMSPLGPLTMASDANALIGLWMEGQKYFAATVQEEMAENDDLPVFNDAKSWLDKYFAGGLCEIPYGEITTYGQLAKEIAKKRNKPGMSAQAIGGAVGHNPISIIIPCHRVVGSAGSLTGYAGGIEKKIQLLALEGVDMSSMSIPKKGTAL